MTFGPPFGFVDTLASAGRSRWGVYFVDPGADGDPAYVHNPNRRPSLVLTGIRRDARRYIFHHDPVLFPELNQQRLARR